MSDENFHIFEISPRYEYLQKQVAEGHNPFTIEVRPAVARDGERLIPTVEIYAGGVKRLEVRDTDDNPAHQPKTEAYALQTAVYLASGCIRIVHELLRTHPVQSW